MKKRIRINGFIIFLAVLSVAVFPNIFLRQEAHPIFDEATEIIGIAIILLGQILRVSSRGYKAECSQNGHALIKGGPYALVRNPMYLGILLIGVGITLLLFKWWVVTIFLFVFIMRYLRLIFKEEKKLLSLFPQEYPDYQRKVPRILPSPNSIFNWDVSDYLPLKLSWLKKEITSIIALLFIAVLLESWEDIKEGGLNAYLKELMAIGLVILLFILIVLYLNRRSHNFEKDVSG